MIWSAARARKSPNMISQTGTIPLRARPLPRPTMADSLIGVLRTRPGNSRLRFLVTLKAPP